MAKVTPTKKKASTSKPSSGMARVKGENFYRDAKKAARVKMLTGGKPVRDKQGNIIQAAAFQKGEEFAKPGRVPADRRWFGEFLTCSLRQGSSGWIVLKLSCFWL